MAEYPSYEVVPYSNPVTEEMQFKTLFSNYDDLGKEARKRKWLYPKRDITISYNNITLTQARILFEFFKKRYGSYESFSFFKYESETYEGEYIGTGDGSTTVYNLPCKNSTARSIYENNSSRTEGPSGDVVVSAGGGADGADRAEFVVAPANGSRLTMDFTGYLKVKCRFYDDLMSFDTFYRILRNVGIKLKGILNE